jgi:tetratricopeptide (TPR) repeat protein
MRYGPALTVSMLLIAVSLAFSARAQQKPFTQEQVQGLVRSGLGDDSGAKLIDQRGIDFVLTQDFLQGLKAAGANETFLEALRKAKRPQPASAKKPVRQVQILAHVLGQERKWDDAAAAARQAVRLNPNDDLAHANLGFALGEKGDRDGEIAEYREALRLNPSNEGAHFNLGAALGNRGDSNGEIAEYRQALRLNPSNEDAHVKLGVALGTTGDLNGEMAE